MVYPHSYRTEHSETRTTNASYGAYYAQHTSKKIRVQPELLKIIQYIDSNRARFIEELAEAIEIKSIAGDLKYKDDVQKMIDFTCKWLFELGLKYECFNIGFYELEGKKVRLPTIILASLGHDVRKKTVCVYIHLDVKNPDICKWVTDPWKLTVEDEKYIYGNGVSSGKGTLMHWFHTIQAFQYAGIEVPVNLKFVFDSMYHQNSRGLSEFLFLRTQDFLVGIDYVIVCDSEWLGEKHPCIIYASVGIIHGDLYVEKNQGGDSKTDPRNDLVEICKEIVDEEERVLIPHFNDIVSQITPEEEKVYEIIRDFDIEEARKNLPPFKQNWDQVKLLMNYWRLPSIWIGETEECICPNKETDIVKRHFIIKIVPRQIITQIKEQMAKYTEQTLAKKLNIENKVRCEFGQTTRFWHENIRSAHYEAARKATIQIYKEDPNMIREDRERIVPVIFDEVLENNILFLPLVTKGSNVGGENENVSKRNFFEATKLIGAYLFQVAAIKEDKETKKK